MEEKFVIHAFGRTVSNKSVFCKIIGYTPNFFINPLEYQNMGTSAAHVIARDMPIRVLDALTSDSKYTNRKLLKEGMNKFGER